MARTEIRKKLADLCLMDDIFFTAVMEDSPECVELILQIIMNKPDLHVQTVEAQRTISNLGYHGVRLDVMATAGGKVYDIEVQRSDTGAIPQRARFNSYLIGVKQLRSGAEYKEVPQSYVIFITEHDVLGDGLPIYHIERMIRETGKPFNDGDFIIYVNGEIKDDTKLGRLMQDFFNKEPNKMNYPLLANRTRYFKNEEGGGKKMSEITQSIFDKGVCAGEAKGEIKGKVAMVIEMLQDKQPISLIVKFSKFTAEKIRQIARENNIAIVE